MTRTVNGTGQARPTSSARPTAAPFACPCATIETKIPFLDYRAREYPLWLCVIALVAGDLYGLTRREGEVREGDKEGVTIGHDAHIAGAALGAAFWLMGAALVLPLKIAGKPFKAFVNVVHF